MNLVLKTSEIKVETQPRKDFSKVSDIANSIEEIGLMQPVTVRKNKEGVYILIDGEQRLRAFGKLGRETIPAYVVEFDDHAAKEAQMMTNLMRSDLTLIERMRGFQMLLENAPAKYNELVIANKFGLKEKEVKRLVAFARSLDPAVDASLASGHYDDEEMDRLAAVPKQFQAAVMAAADRSGHNIDNGIRSTSEELIFDSVFTLEQARSSGKLHVKDPWTDIWRTFDKPYAAQAKKDYEARTKKKHQQELAKEKTQTVKQKEQSAEQKKKKFEKEKEERTKALKDLREAVVDIIAKNRSEKEVRRILQDNLRKLQAEQLKTLLRAFGVEFKGTNCSTDDLRKMAFTNKAVFGFVTRAEELVSVISMIDCASFGIDAKDWTKAIRKIV